MILMIGLAGMVSDGFESGDRRVDLSHLRSGADEHLSFEKASLLAHTRERDEARSSQKGDGLSDLFSRLPASSGSLVMPMPTPEPELYVEPVVSSWTAPPVRDQGWYDYIYSLAAVWPWDAHTATRVILCESGGNATSYSPYGYYGAMQINHWFPDWDVLEVNIAYGYNNKYAKGGWNHWWWCYNFG